MRKIKNKSEVCIFICMVLLFATAPVQATWDGYVEAHSAANDPPAGASNPADDTLSFTVEQNGNTRQWVPNPPVLEADWDNDNWAVGGNISWHRATSGATQAESKAKAGFDASSKAVVLARARVRDIVNNNLGDNGGDNSALATSKAQLMPQLQFVKISGPGTYVDANMTAHIYMTSKDASSSPSTGVTGTKVITCPLPVGTVFQLGYVATAKAQYPVIISGQPGSIVDYNVTVDGATASTGSATLYQGESSPSTTGGLSGTYFETFVEIGPDGEWSNEGYYGAIYLELTLPDGYTFETHSGRIPTMSEWGLIILGLLLLTAGAIVIVRRTRLAT
jgi:hypothetical protein